MGSDKEGQCFFLPGQMACVKDHTELILRKEKAIFRLCILFQNVFILKLYLYFTALILQKWHILIRVRALLLQISLSLSNCVSLQIL